jgi:folate-binding Fe-S cluster repair protein YgfZ
MLEMRGQVKRRLVPIALDGSDVPARGAEIVDAAGQKVGEVTSAALLAARPIALGMVKRKLAEAGTALTVGGAPGRVIAPET